MSKVTRNDALFKFIQLLPSEKLFRKFEGRGFDIFLDEDIQR